ncbi:MAG: lamin tail domain-containing protein [Candidatus Woesearchaeota archaeon]
MRYLFLLLIPFIAPMVSAEIIISAVNYNPPGADDGYEWIEIYNEGERTLLENYSIEMGNGVNADEWHTEWEGSEEWIGRGEYLVIGEEEVIPEPDVIRTLDLQNGPDAIRLTKGDEVQVVGWGEHEFSEYYEREPVAAGEGPLVRESNTGNNAEDFSYREYIPHSRLSKSIELSIIRDTVEITNLSMEDDIPGEGIQISPLPGKTRQVKIRFTVTNCNGTSVYTVPETELSNEGCEFEAGLSIPYSKTPEEYLLEVHAENDDMQTNETLIYEVLSLRAFEIDTDYLEFSDEIRGDSDFSTDMRPTIKNSGNVEISISLITTGITIEDLDYKVEGYDWFSFAEQHQFPLDVGESFGISLRAGEKLTGRHDGELMVVAE